MVAIQSDHEQLRNKLINQLMPIYLNFSINRITREMRSFRNEFARFKQQEQRKYKAQSISEITSKFSEEKSQSAVIFIGAVNNLMDKFSIADSRVKSLVRYCKYLIYTSNLYGKNESYCTTDTRIANAFKTLNQYKEDIEALRKFEKWAYENLDIQGSRVSDYAKKIDDWIAQGDSRWTLAEQVPVIPPTLEETIAAEMENESSLFNLN